MCLHPVNLLLICGVFFYLCSGYEGLTNGLMSELPSDLVSYNRPVRCVHWNTTEDAGNTVEVECDDGERIAADHVIVTVPLGKFSTHPALLLSLST